MRLVFSRTTQVLLDLFLLSAAYWLAFALRFEGSFPEQILKRTVFLWPYVVGLQYFALVATGATKFIWRYIGLREVRTFSGAFTMAAIGLLLVRLIAGLLQVKTGYAQYLLVPAGVVLINLPIAFISVVGVRATRRLMAERTEVQSRRIVGSAETPTILIGAGQAGLIVAKELSARPDVGIRPVFFVDDDPRKRGKVIQGLPVRGATSDIPALARQHDISQALITMASVPGKEIRRIQDICQSAGLKTKIVPGLYEIVGGTFNVSRIREVAIEDLLRRDSVQLNENDILSFIRGRSVMVTGAGGSIGSELCRQICIQGPAKLVLAEQAENSLFEIHRELLGKYPSLEIVPAIADVTDAARVEELLDTQQPAVIFHAAAHKHVPMMEWNVGEAVKNNVFGTITVAQLSAVRGVEAFVMISTDKAVNPTSVMGATKRIAEMYVQALAATSATRFVTVRFGNVLGSAGSVVRIFREQIAQGGPVTVTHPEMRRYFMTIPEACQLVLQAGSMGEGGEIFVLDMGEPVRIVDLALDLIRLSGFRPNDDVEIVFTGLRPGEKLFEELVIDGETTDKTKHPKIFVGRSKRLAVDDLKEPLNHLRDLTIAGDSIALRQALKILVPEYRIGSAATPHEASERVSGDDAGKSSLKAMPAGPS